MSLYFDWDIEDISNQVVAALDSSHLKKDRFGRLKEPLYPEHLVRIFKLMDTWLVELVDGKLINVGYLLVAQVLYMLRWISGLKILLK